MKEVFVAQNTLGDGSTWDVAFSKDPQQKYLYLADGKNEKIYIIQRDTMQILTSFGDGGRQPGQFFAVHSIATDAKGNIYTAETYEADACRSSSTRGLAPSPHSIRAPSGRRNESERLRVVCAMCGSVSLVTSNVTDGRISVGRPFYLPFYLTT